MKALRTGVTTGLCAAAAAKGAAIMLLTSKPAVQVEVEARNGEVKHFTITDAMLGSGFAQCAVQKDAGDDPDVTNGMKVFATLTRTAGNGIEIDGGEGIGRVTKPGLKVPVGEAAINPVPREMIRASVEEICRQCAYTGGLKALISIPGGEVVARKTLNGRLGIEGGLSVLGTTGIVEPMSEKAILETIKTEIDVLIAAGKESLLITPGNYGRDFAKNVLGLDMETAIKCSNFIGETLDHVMLRDSTRIILIGHAGKLVKLAGGVMHTHSSVADCRMEIIAVHCALAGASTDTIRQIMDCVTVEAAISLMKAVGVNDAVWQSIGRKIGYHLHGRTKGRLSVEYIVFTQEEGVLVHERTDVSSGDIL